MLHSDFCHEDIQRHTTVARHSNNSIRIIRIHNKQRGRYCVHCRQNCPMDMVFMDRNQD